KWLGVVGVAAVMLAVTATGVFLFTGYLRNQLAVDEVQPYVARGKAISEDRLVLETQVLAARVSVMPTPPILKEEDENQIVDDRITKAKVTDPLFNPSEETRAKMIVELREEFRSRWLALGPGETRMFEFRGLE